MKSTVLFALLLLSATANGFLVDKDGEPLMNGGTYYVLPYFEENGGGIKLAATGGETCPLTVVQSPSEDSKGSPITISHMERILFISSRLTLDIEFISAAACVSSREWRIVQGLPEGPAVKIGYRNAMRGDFYLRGTSENAYKFEFCAAGANDNCGHIGISTDKNGNRRLVITQDDDPLLVQFERAEQNHLFSSTDND